MSCCGERERVALLSSLSLLCYCSSQRAAQCIIHGSVLYTASSLSISLSLFLQTNERTSSHQKLRAHGHTHVCVKVVATLRHHVLGPCYTAACTSLSLSLSLSLSPSLPLSLSPAAAITLSGPQRAHTREALHVRSRYCPLSPPPPHRKLHTPASFQRLFFKLHIQKQGAPFLI